jgi:uncharacterized membrane protein HdeD (DUF308 family)
LSSLTPQRFSSEKEEGTGRRKKHGYELANRILGIFLLIFGLIILVFHKQIIRNADKTYIKSFHGDFDDYVDKYKIIVLLGGTLALVAGILITFHIVDS